MLDHKLVRTQIEPISLYQYQTTGEEFYCAPREGACGATVPLRKFYNLADSGKRERFRLFKLYRL